MALFYPNAHLQTNLVLILRKTYKGVHSAQVGFPGGKYEDDDKDLMTTAIARNRGGGWHVLLGKSRVNIIKPMSPLYIPPSNYMVHPFLGVMSDTPQFYKQEEEVEDITRSCSV
jgi:8-oxo-dGTP pyrophosphatase MutT (NUDIX family)